MTIAKYSQKTIKLCENNQTKLIHIIKHGISAKNDLYTKLSTLSTSGLTGLLKKGLRVIEQTFCEVLLNCLLKTSKQLDILVLLL